MLSFISTYNFENYLVISMTITVIGISIGIINSYNEFGNIIRLRQVDATRVLEGLPTDVTLTPEDFIANPELAEIFGVTGTDTNLEIALESNEHFEFIQNELAQNELAQNEFAPIDFDNLMALYEVIEAFISSFF